MRLHAGCDLHARSNHWGIVDGEGRRTGPGPEPPSRDFWSRERALYALITFYLKSSPYVPICF